jgi:hypothetical protein
LINNSEEEFHSLVVSSDDPATSELDGFIQGNEFSMKVWKYAHNLEAIASIEIVAGDTTFEPMGSTVIQLNTTKLGANDWSESLTSLGNAYPNPFRNFTTIPFTISEQEGVELSIYNILGQHMATLVNERLSPGSYLMDWKVNIGKSSQIMPGVYFIKLVAGDKIFVKPVELVIN